MMKNKLMSLILMVFGFTAMQAQTTATTIEEATKIAVEDDKKIPNGF